MLRWDEMRTRMLSFMKDYDAIICPAAASPALPHGTSFDYLSSFSYTMTFNFTGWPAAVVRCGTSPEGLPINVQIVARPWREDVALAAAMHLEKVFGGWRPATGFGRAAGASA
jgi:amidase